MNNNKSLTNKMNYIRNELKKYLDEVMQYHYNQNDNGHDIEHAKYVVERSLKFAEEIKDINYEMVYTIAIYHDIAHHIDAKNHEILSAKLLKEDKKIHKFFTEEQIKIMGDAIEDHRSSLKEEPRSIYGKIVSSADRNTDVLTTLKRCYSYNKKHYPELNDIKLIEQCRLFLLDKYGINGYAREKIYFNDSAYKNYLDDITNLAMNKKEFFNLICVANNIK